MATMSGPGPDPYICEDGGCFPPQPLPTPDILANVSHAALACAIVLGVALLIMAVIPYRTVVPFWRRRLVLAIAIVCGLALLLAQRASATYGTYAHYGMPENSSYAAWVARAGEGVMAQVGQITDWFGLFVIVCVLATAVLTCLSLWQIGVALLLRRAFLATIQAD